MKTKLMIDRDVVSPVSGSVRRASGSPRVFQLTRRTCAHPTAEHSTDTAAQSLAGCQTGRRPDRSP